jgi:hypothetical protein
MAERQTTYSIDPKDYAGKYDPALEELRELPGVGVFAYSKALSEQERAELEQRDALKSDLQYRNLHRDTVLTDAWRRYYKRKEGEDYVGTDQEAVDDFMSEFAYIDNNLSFGLGKTLINMQGLSEDEKFDIGLLYDRYNRTDAFGEGSRPFISQLGDVVWAGVTDPFNYLGVATGGAALLARGAAGAVGGQAAKKALIEGFKKTAVGKMSTKYGEQVTKRPVIASTLAGGGWMGLYDVEAQNVELESGFKDIQADLGIAKEGFDYDRLAIMMASGSGLGAGLGIAGKAIGKKLSKGSYDEVLGKDRTDASLEDLKVEAEERGIQVEPKDLQVEQERLQVEQTVPYTREDGTLTNATVISRTVTEIEGEPKRVEFTLKDTETGDLYTEVLEQGAPLVKQYVPDSTDYQAALRIKDLEENLSAKGAMLNTWDKIKTAFSSERGVGREVAERYRMQQTAIRATEKRVVDLVKKIDDEFKKVKGKSLERASREEQEAFIRILSSSKEDSPLKATNAGFHLLSKNGKEWTKMEELTDEYKELVVNTSDELLKSGLFDRYKTDANGDFILDKDGERIENNIVKTFKKNIDNKTYVNRQLRMYDDPEYTTTPIREAMGQSLFLDTRRMLMEKLDLNEEAAVTLMEDVRVKSGVEELKRLGSLSKRKLKQKETEVRAILGEVTDPKSVMFNTVLKTKRMSEEFKFRQDLVALGMTEGNNKKIFMVKGAGREGVLAPMEPKGKGIRPDIEALEKQLRPEAVEEAKKKIVKQFEKDGLDPTAAIEAAEKAEYSTVYNNPYDGLFVDPVWKQHFDNMVSFKSPDEIERLLAKPTFWFRTAKLILSPATHVRDFIGGNVMLMGNGILPISRRAWSKMVMPDENAIGNLRWSVFRDTMPLMSKIHKGASFSKDDEKRLTRLTELGVLHNGTRVGIFRESVNAAFKKGHAVDETEELILNMQEMRLKDRPIAAIRKKTIDPLTEVYEMWDSLNKIAAFEHEFGFLYKAFGDGANNQELARFATQLGVPSVQIRRRINAGEITSLIEEAAARKVRDFLPSYDYLPPIHKQLRKYQLGNFTSFSMELIRNYKNSWNLARIEMLSKNPTMRARGSIRAASLAGMSAVSFTGAGGASAWLMGISKDQKKALESDEMSAPWETATSNIYLSGIENGKATVIPMAFVDPYSYLSRIAKTALNSFNRGDEEDFFVEKMGKATMDALLISLDPYIEPAAGPATLAKVMLPFLEGSDDMDFDRSFDLLKKTFTPNFLLDLEKAFGSPFASSDYTKWGTPKDPASYTMMAWVTGMKRKTLDVPVKLGFALKTQERKKSRNKGDFSRFLNQPVNFEGAGYKERIMEKYKDYLEGEMEIQRTVNKLYRFGNVLGLDNDTVFDLSTTSRKDPKALAAGAGKYRANFSEDYFIEVNGDHYYLPFEKVKTRELIMNSLLKYQKGDMSLLDEMDQYVSQIDRRMRKD